MVTGHRPERLNGRELEVTEWFDSQIRELQPTIAISGMAAGADQIYAELALKQRIPLAAAILFLQFGMVKNGAVLGIRLSMLKIKERRLDIFHGTANNS